MALELKGLKGKALKAAANLDRLNAAYDKFNENAAAHATDVEGMAPQIEALQEDLTFATAVLGNSVNGSQDSQPKPVAQQTVPPAVQQPETPKTEPMVTATDSGSELKPGGAVQVDAPGMIREVPHVATLSDRISTSNWIPPR